MGWPADLTWYKLFTDWGSLIGGIFALIAGGLLYWISRKQFTLSRAEFTSTHRPRIIVRNLSTFGVVVGGPITINFMVINIGESPAVINSIEACIFLKSATEKVSRGLRLTTCTIAKERLVSGEFEIASQTSTFSPEQRHVEMLQKGERSLCIAGCVNYADENKVNRRTGFVRYCDLIDISRGIFFDAIDDKEYEYAY
jgi:hypothetical protein